jgi:uncharacterized protein (DUF2384 family)
VIEPPTADSTWRTVVLVEGESDQAALEVLARRRGRVLAEDGVFIVPMSGASNIGTYLRKYGPDGLNLRLAGLCDAPAARYFRSNLEHVGLDVGTSVASMEQVGFFVCDRDLEDELVRALGTAVVEEIIDGQGELASLRRLRQQPQHRDGRKQDHLRRFMGSKSRRKLQYARLMAQALDDYEIPHALDGLLDYV